MKNIHLAVIAMLVLLACSPSSQEANVAAADRVFLNGAIYTVDENRSWAEAIAIKDGRIVYVGDNAGAGGHIDETTQVTDLRKQMLLPGFHDSHIHIMIGVMAGLECSLLRLETVEAVAARLKECTSLTGIGDDGLAGSQSTERAARPDVPGPAGVSRVEFRPRGVGEQQGDAGRWPRCRYGKSAGRCNRA
jgi:hypothetical protein